MWLVVFTGTLIIGLDIGLGIGILFSLLTIIIRTILYDCVCMCDVVYVFLLSPAHSHLVLVRLKYGCILVKSLIQSLAAAQRKIYWYGESLSALFRM